MVGTSGGGIGPAKTKNSTMWFNGDCLRWRTKPVIAARTTMIATLVTVKVVLLMKARRTTASPTDSTCLTLSTIAHWLGRLNARSDVSLADFPAVTRMKAKEIRKSSRILKVIPTPMVRLK